MEDRFLSKWAAIADTQETALCQNGDSLPSDVHLLKKGNVKPVKSSFNGEGLVIMQAHTKTAILGATKLTKAMIDAYVGGIVSLWSSYYFATQVYRDCKIFTE